MESLTAKYCEQTTTQDHQSEDVMRSRRLIRQSLLVIPLLIMSAASLAADKIVIGVEDIQYLPHYHSDKGVFIGFARDLFDAFAAENNLDVTYRPMSIPRLYKALAEKKIDLKYPDNPNWKKNLKQGVAIEYSEPVVPFLDGVMVKTLGQEVKRLGTVIGFTPWAWLDRIQRGQVSLHENPSFIGLVRQVLQGRIDGAYINVDVAQYSLRKLLRRDGELQFDSSLPYSEGNYFASSSRNPELIVRFNHWMKNRKQKIEQLKKRWLIQ